MTSSHRRSRLITELLFLFVVASTSVVTLGEENAIDRYYSAALTAFQQGDAHKASALLTKLLETREDIPEAHNLLGVVFDQMGNGSKAEDHFKRAIELRPDYLEARSNFARYLISQGNLEAALRLTYAGFEKPEIHFMLVNALRRQKAFGKSLDHALEITRDFPDYPVAHLYVGIELQFQGRFREAKEHYTKAAVLSEKLPKLRAEAKFGLARVLAKEGNYAAAIPLLKESIGQTPGDVEARLELAGIYLKTGAYQDAVTLLQEALSLNPQERRTHFVLGNVLNRLGRQPEAQKHFGIFLELERKQNESESGKPTVYTKSRD
jgi:protein O-GlcNAc transferase